MIAGGGQEQMEKERACRKSLGPGAIEKQRVGWSAIHGSQRSMTRPLLHRDPLSSRA